MAKTSSKITPTNYYVVNHKNLLDPFVYARRFPSYQDAAMAIKLNKETTPDTCSVEKGSKLLVLGLHIKSKAKRLNIDYKYRMPKDRVTPQDRKSYRTLQRIKFRKKFGENYTGINTIINQN